MVDVLVQTRLPAAIPRVVQRRAKAEGDSVAGWIRRLMIREVGSMRIGAFVAHHNQADPQVLLRQGYRPHYYAEPVRDVSATERVFVLLHGEGSGGVPGTPVQQERYMESQAFQRPEDHRFVLEGSPTRWNIVTSMFDATSKRIELTLRVDLSVG